ncbi:MAG: DUF5410 family protein [Rickettsia endosymbiont of Pentastiridius leporinus]
MGFKELIVCFSTSEEKDESYNKGCAELAQKNQQKEVKEYLKLVQKVSDREIDLLVLKDMSRLKKEEKQKFLEDIKDKVPLGILHALNKKIMEHAIDLVEQNDKTFLLRRGEDAIFRDLFYLEAKRNNSGASIDEKGLLVINLSSTLLEHYQTLIDSFYKKKFKSTEILEKINRELGPDSEFISLGYKEKYYTEKNIAHSIMVLFISNIFKKDIFNKETDPIKIQKFAELDKYLNDLNGKYFKDFKNSEFIEDVSNQIHIQGEITITFETL